MKKSNANTMRMIINSVTQLPLDSPSKRRCAEPEPNGLTVGWRRRSPVGQTLPNHRGSFTSSVK